MTYIRIFFILIFTFIFSGCQMTTKIPNNLGSERTYELRHETYKIKPCCTELNALKQSSINDSLTVTMEENEDLIQVGSIKSPYQLIKLDDKENVQFYSVKSFYLEHKFAFIPMVSVLDSSFNIIKQTDLEYMRYKHQDLVYDDSHFWMYFSIDKKISPEAHYILIHSAKELGATVSINSDSYGGAQMTMIGGQPIVYHQDAASFKVNPVASPSGVIIIKKLDFWSKPVNDWVIQPL
ncbi:Lipoprotein [Pseudoalteromonas distincta]